MVESRLCRYRIVRSDEEPWKWSLTINSEESGKFYFYVLVEDKLVYSN